MSGERETRTIEVGPEDPRHVNIVVENGGECTVNIEISSSYNTTNNYSCPEWFNEESFTRILHSVRG